LKNNSFGSETGSAIFIGKWTVKIVNLLKNSPLRHGQLRRGLGNVSQRMLTRTLRHLESSGLIKRQVTQSKSGSEREFVAGPMFMPPV